jgi:class 3 adenylate cyclase
MVAFPTTAFRARQRRLDAPVAIFHSRRMDAADFEAAGLYDPKAPNAAERLELLEWLASRGLTIEQMVVANREASLTGLAADEILHQGGLYTIADVVVRTGLSAERVRELNLAVGLPVGQDERVFTDETVQLYGFFKEGATLFGSEALLRFFRTIGWSLARMAEAAVSLFYINVEGPMRQKGMSERALAEATIRAIQSLDGLELMIRNLFHAHMESAILRFRRLRLGRQVDSARMTVGFVDLVGFTTLSSRLSSSELVDMVERFETTAHDVVTARGGRVVKLIGDEVMFVAAEAAAACDAALALVEHFADDPSVTPRGALATGDLVIRGGDYYGPIVNLASRVAELAVPAELLVTAEVAAEVQSPSIRFEPAGKRMLRGFEAPIALLTVGRA